MLFLNAILPYLQISIAALLIASIILQQAGAGLSETFGGSGVDGGFHTRRGLEKILFQTTIILGVLFSISALMAILI